MSDWRAGAAALPVPVPIGTPLAGYMARTGPSVGTRDELTAGALVLAMGDRRMALIAVDLISVDFGMVEAIAARTGFPVAGIALCASHTHSGPSGVTDRLHPARPEVTDEALRDVFVSACATVVLAANARLVEARLSAGWTTARDVAASRLTPDGPRDQPLFVLRAQGVDDRPIATMINMACHPTILPAESCVVSADFPGALRRRLDPGDHGVILYTNGAAGDISTRFTRLSQDGAEVERVGEVLANAVVSLQQVETIGTDLSCVHAHCALPFRTGDQVRSRYEAAPRSAGDRSGRIEVTRRQGLEILEGMMRGADSDRFEADIGIWRVGEFTLIGVPGELFSTLGSALVAGDPRKVILGYTNGYAGYIPDEAAYHNGTYEALASPYEPETVSAFVEWIGSLL